MVRGGQSRSVVFAVENELSASLQPKKRFVEAWAWKVRELLSKRAEGDALFAASTGELEAGPFELGIQGECVYWPGGLGS